MAKYVVSWELRLGGSGQENHESGRRLLDTFGKWQMPGDQEFLQFVARVDGQGGYAVVETDNPAGLQDAPTKFSPWLQFEVHPVVDIADNVVAVAEGAEFRETI
ncbi:MAG: hypothetical protein JJLCMIEE_01725 [Acidimicrobiales bacterium]|nr:MAG: DUF3303 domain-containing protein [Actinomycetota bacterium]MBV6508660.1 hypothetical protein [Acidimicrobiales bacterium]RIK08104.1 MAG: DUF3303 domain-containing protein [Acidobacteriota bacterium]